MILQTEPQRASVRLQDQEQQGRNDITGECDEITLEQAQDRVISPLPFWVASGSPPRPLESDQERLFHEKDQLVHPSPVDGSKIRLISRKCCFSALGFCSSGDGDAASSRLDPTEDHAATCGS